MAADIPGDIPGEETLPLPVGTVGGSSESYSTVQAISAGDDAGILNAESILAATSDAVPGHVSDSIPGALPDNAPEPVSLPVSLGDLKDLKASATQAISQAKDSAGQALAQVKETTGQTLDQAKTKVVGQVRSRVEEQKGKAADSLDGLHTSVTDFAQTFRQNNLPQLAEYTDSLNGQIDKMAGYLKENDIDTVVQDASQFARDNPALFLAGAFVVGIAVGRFLRSSNKGIASAG